MTRNTKILLLGTGVTVAVGTLAYFVCKKAASRKKATEVAKQETDAAGDETPTAVALDAKEFAERRKEALQKRTEITSDEMTTNATDLTEETEFVAEQASGLFMEAVRIIKEMRGATNGRYPQIAMWENVPGAFSSHKGEDFRLVLEELCKICNAEITIPRPTDKRGNGVNG